MWRRWLLVLGAITLYVGMLTAIDIAFPVVSSLYKPHNDVGDNSRYQKYNNDNNPKSRWERITDDPIALVTLCLVIVTGILAGSTVGLWSVTRRSVRIAEQSLIDVERALVIITDVSVSGLVRENRILDIR